jgi:hypothetical protein
MALDPTNPGVPPTDPSLLEWRTKSVAIGQRQAEAMEKMAAAEAGAPSTEGGIFLEILKSVLIGKLAATSDDAVIWAKDLTQEYLKLYDLLGVKRV